MDWFAQTAYGVRFDWGPEGSARVSPGCAALVIVDVLSFSSSVTVAVDAGTRVYPYRWRDESAVAFARERDAVLAGGRRSADAGTPWSLSPAALRRAPYTPRLVLPSPNGSAIAAASRAPRIIAGCLRNATAVGRWLARQGFGSTAEPVVLVAAGERWPDDSLRPALEDLLGAGAVIAALASAAPRATLSPEASVAAAIWSATGDPAGTVRSCASGVELASGGFADDVEVATEVDASTTVPLRTDAAFTAAG